MAEQEKPQYLSHQQKLLLLQQFCHLSVDLKIVEKLTSYSLAIERIGYSNMNGKLSGQVLLAIVTDENKKMKIVQRYFSRPRKIAKLCKRIINKKTIPM